MSPIQRHRQLVHRKNSVSVDLSALSLFSPVYTVENNGYIFDFSENMGRYVKNKRAGKMARRANREVVKASPQQQPTFCMVHGWVVPKATGCCKASKPDSTPKKEEMSASSDK